MAELKLAQVERAARIRAAQERSEGVIAPPTFPRLLLLEEADEGVVAFLASTPTPEGELPLGGRGRAWWKALPLGERVRVATLTLSLIRPFLPLLRGRDRADALALIERARAVLRAAERKR